MNARRLSGLFSCLQTHDNYRKHGFGSLVTKALAKKVAEMGHDSYAGIADENISSKRLFEKIGFKAAGRLYWLRTELSATDEKH